MINRRGEHCAPAPWACRSLAAAPAKDRRHRRPSGRSSSQAIGPGLGGYCRL